MTYTNETINNTLLNNHIFFLNGEIDEYSTGECIKWILSENLSGRDDELILYINTPGGELAAAFALIDIMRESRLPIKTIGIGAIHSAGFLIFASGTPGRRIISKNASIMIHQYTTAFGGKQHDMKAHVRELELSQHKIVNLLSEITGYNEYDVMEYFVPPSDVWLTAQELVSYKIADEVSK
jgi:ATP-dependent Clp protease protease subunit